MPHTQHLVSGTIPFFYHQPCEREIFADIQSNLSFVPVVTIIANVWVSSLLILSQLPPSTWYMSQLVPSAGAASRTNYPYYCESKESFVTLR